MTTGDKAKRATVAIGPLSVDGFQMLFGVERSESEALFAQRLQADLSALGEACAEPDALREQMARLEQQLRDAGLEPWQLPPTER